MVERSNSLIEISDKGVLEAKPQDGVTEQVSELGRFDKSF